MSKKRYEYKVYSEYTVMEGLSTPFDYLDKARLLGLSGVAVTDRMTVAGIYDWEAAREKLPLDDPFLSVFGVELMVQNDLFPEEFHSTFCVSVLARNVDGMRMIYRILTACAKVGKDTAVSLQYLLQHRVNLLIGSCTEQGIFFHRTNQNMRPESFFDAAAIFDYLEICPSMEQDIVTIITMLGEHQNIPTVAVSDARYCYRAQKPHYHAICSANALKDVMVHEKELCSAKQLLSRFAYLGEEKARQVVYDNTEKLAEQIEPFQLFSTMLQSIAPDADGVADAMREAIADAFPDGMPDFIAERVQQETAYFAREGLFGHLQTLYSISEEIGPCFAVNAYAVSYLLYLLGVTQVNPLPPHLNCPDCHSVTLMARYTCGDAVACPVCGRISLIQGADLPFASFERSGEKNILSFGCTKPGLTFGKDALAKLFSEEHLCRLGMFRTMSYPRFRKFYTQLSRDRGDCLPPLCAEQSFDRLSTLGGGMSLFTDDETDFIITPPEKSVVDVTALCRDHAARDGMLLTSCGLEDLYRTGLTAVQFRTSPMLQQLMRLEQHSELSITKDTPYVLEAITALMTDSKLLSDLPRGSLGYLVHLFDEFPPESFSKLADLFSIGHSSKLWVNNFSELVGQGTVQPENVFTDLDSLYAFLMEFPLDPQIALEITRAVSVGNGAQAVDKTVARILQNAGLPEWLVPVLHKIRRLHPHVYGVTEADIFCRLVWYRMHDPKLYAEICGKEKV